VLTREPDWSKVRAGTPPALLRLAQRCLRKDPRRRPQSMGDVRVALEDIAAGEPQPAGPSVGRRSNGRVWAWIAAGLIAVGGIVGTVVPWLVLRPVARTARTLPMFLGEGVTLTPEEAPAFALSPDGNTLVFVGGIGNSRQLYLRHLDSTAATALRGTEGASSPFFSPDGQWVAFVASESLKKVRVAGGGPPIRLTSATDRGGAWLENDTIVYCPDRRGPLQTISAAGGEAKALTRTSDRQEVTHRFPTAVPGRAILFTVRHVDEGATAIAALDLRTGTETTVLAGAYHPTYAAPGRLLFMREASLFSVAFDIDRLAVSGPETRLVDALRSNTNVMAGQYAVSGSTLLYQSGGLETNLDRGIVVWRDAKGQEQPLIAEPDTYRDLRFSPDGKRLAYALLPEAVGTDVWVFDRLRGLKTRLTHDAPAAEWWPVWSPDGRFIAYAETLGGINLMSSDGSGERQRLTSNTQQWQVPMSFSPDGKLLAYHELRPETAADIWILPLAPKGQPQVFLKTPFYEGLPVFSPNGRWIAYSSNESGAFEVYVRPFPGPGPKQQVSGDQSFDVHYWSADGKKLFYRSGDGKRMVSVPVRTDGKEFEIGKPTVLFELDPDRYPDLGFWSGFAASPDGSGFVLVKLSEERSIARSYLMMMLDWR
jgi:serine/threonine-protein kinase